MTTRDTAMLRQLPSVDEVLRDRAAQDVIERFGRTAMVEAVRTMLSQARRDGEMLGVASCAERAAAELENASRESLRPVFNLTGTVLHTNLGRALLAAEAVDAAIAAMRSAVALEFDVGDGRRGERDDHVREILREITSAEDATVVNNNAAAVLLAINTVASGREAIVSRGELIEIGGAFRMPEIMTRAGATLVEVGTTNRTHIKDYVEAVTPETGMLLKVHTSNYRIEGFTKEVPPRELVPLARKHGIPLVNDLGSGTLVDLGRFGLRHEPTVAEAVAEGADIITFSGDKLLGGPQTGFIVGRKELIARINRNPMKRALRVDKIRLAALEATLKLYRDPDRLAQRLPTLRLLSRPREELEAAAQRMAEVLTRMLGSAFTIDVVPCASQIGSGALPVDTIPSAGVAIRTSAQRGAGSRIAALGRAFRALPVPVVGRIEEGALVFDMRTLEDEAGFISNLGHFSVREKRDGLA